MPLAAKLGGCVAARCRYTRLITSGSGSTATQGLLIRSPFEACGDTKLPAPKVRDNQAVKI